MSHNSYARHSDARHSCSRHAVAASAHRPPPIFFAPLLCALLLLALLAVPLAHADAAQQRILVFGDSLSAAYRIPEESGWVALLQRQLTEDGLAHQVINASVSGETTAGGLARLPAMLETHRPDIVILELGGNDGLRGLPVSSIRQNLEQMIGLAQDSGASVLLVGIQIPPNYGPRYTTPFYQQYQELADNHNLPLIPFLLEGIADNSALMQDDGIHPTAEAQPMIVDIVWPMLKEML